jgi:hypothetical protein
LKNQIAAVAEKKFTVTSAQNAAATLKTLSTEAKPKMTLNIKRVDHTEKHYVDRVDFINETTDENLSVKFTRETRIGQSKVHPVGS